MSRCHNYFLKIYAGPRHQTGAPNGSFLREMWKDGFSTLQMEMACCQALLDNGHYSRVEITDEIDGTYTQVMLPRPKAKKRRNKT